MANLPGGADPAPAARDRSAREMGGIGTPPLDRFRLDFVVHANGRRDDVVASLRREVDRLNRGPGGRARAPLVVVAADHRSSGDGDSPLLHLSIVPASPDGDAAGSDPPSDELFIDLGDDLETPRTSRIAEAAALLGAEAVSCRSIEELAETVRDRIEARIAEAEMGPPIAAPRSGLGWAWFAAGFALLALCPGPWLRHLDIDLQLPPLDWRVLAPRYPEYVPIWVPPTIGAGFLAFLGFTLWRVRRMRLAGVGRGSADPPRSRLAPLVAALLLVPFLTNAFFTALFFRDGRIIELATEAIHSDGLGMLTAYYPLSEFDREQDQFRYARPKFHMSPNILPFWQPWAFAMVLLGSLAGMTMLAVPWRRQLLLGG